MPSSLKRYYSIGEVAEQFDVSKSLIRFWETEFTHLRPYKNSKGDRRFTKQNIEQVREIFHLVKERGFTLNGAKRELKVLKKQQKELTKAGKTSSDGFVENASRLKSLNSEYGTYTKALSVTLDGTSKQSKAQTTLNNELDKSAKSIDSARASNKELLKIRNQLNLNTVEGKKAQSEINTKIDENNKFIKENVSELEKQKINIGNYGDALTGALESTGLFGTATKGIVTDLKNIITPLSNAVIQMFGLSKAQQGITASTSKSTIGLG